MTEKQSLEPDYSSQNEEPLPVVIVEDEVSEPESLEDALTAF